MSGARLLIYIKDIGSAILWSHLKNKPKSRTFAIGLDIHRLFLHLSKWLNKEFELLININLVGLGGELVALFNTFQITLV